MESSVTATKPHSFIECHRAATPVANILARIGSKWTVYIIIGLTEGPMRFSDLQRRINGISHKMLAQTLRELEADGLITRKVTPIIPPRVDYELTEMGFELTGPLMAISDFTQRNGDRIAASRQSYAQRAAGN